MERWLSSEKTHFSPFGWKRLFVGGVPSADCQPKRPPVPYSAATLWLKWRPARDTLNGQNSSYNISISCSRGNIITGGSIMDYKKVLRLHFMNHLSSREIAESCGDCSKTTVNEFLKRFREDPELSYPLPADVTNEYIESILYKNLVYRRTSFSIGILTRKLSTRL